MRWPSDALVWNGVIEDASEGDVISIRIGTPTGELEIMASIEFKERTLLLIGAHIQSDGGPNSIGHGNLRSIAEFVLERIDCDEARVEGAARTTGANPGHRPRVLWFARRSRDPAG